MALRFGIIRKSASSAPTERAESRENAVVEPKPENLDALQQRLGYSFEDKDLLKRALTHRSAQGAGKANGRPKKGILSQQGGEQPELEDYERLEFLGDAVLDLAVAALLLEEHATAKEGDLSKMRAALVNTKSLAEIALEELELSSSIILSRSELSSGGAERPSILADVVEALLGAVYREAGYSQALAIVKSLFGARISEVSPSDPKTELQEALHSLGCGEPQYFLEHREGPEHSPIFVSTVEVDGQKVGTGKGSTKKSSQQRAAAEALALLVEKDEIDARFYRSQRRFA